MSRSLSTIGVPGLLGGGLSADEWFESLGGTLYTRFNELSGNLINYGSDGNSGVNSNVTQGQTGQLGPNEAYLYNGTTSISTFANADLPGTKALTTQRWCFLVKAATAGESSVGTIYATNTVTNLRLRSSNRADALIDTDGTSANAFANVNQVSILGAWALVFLDYDDADALGLGRRIRIIVATAAGAATLATLGTDTAATGTIVAAATDFTLGNIASTARTFDGLIDVAFVGPGLWSPAGSPADLSLCEEGRSIIFG